MAGTEQKDKNIWLKVLIGILFSLIMCSFSLSGSAFSKALDNSSEIKEIKTNYEWIVKSLDRIEKALGVK